MEAVSILGGVAVGDTAIDYTNRILLPMDVVTRLSAEANQILSDSFREEVGTHVDKVILLPHPVELSVGQQAGSTTLSLRGMHRLEHNLLMACDASNSFPQIPAPHPPEQRHLLRPEGRPRADPVRRRRRHAVRGDLHVPAVPHAAPGDGRGGRWRRDHRDVSGPPDHPPR